MGVNKERMFAVNKTVRLGVIGLGQRGPIMLDKVILPLKDDGVLVTAICDLLEDRTEAAADLVEKAGFPRPMTTKDYREVLASDNVDAVYIAVSWEYHVDIAVEAMKAGKYSGIEVGCAYSITDCYKLVDTFEETGTYCMFMENCCFGKRELMALNMVRKGVFGEIVACSGAYGHDLREEISKGKENRYYRLRNYLKRNCDNYPTHELGPIAKLLNINNGNRFLTVSSFSTEAKGMHTFVGEKFGKDHPLYNETFRQGDIITTVIKCSEGQTIVLTLDTQLPRYYSRSFTVRGTKGSYFEENDSIYLDGVHRKDEDHWQNQWGNAAKYEEEYLHPLWKEGVQKDMHGGIDHLMFAAFIDSVRNNCRPPIDVYDGAAYMCISALSEQSISMGGAPVPVPDFTRGKWTMRTDIVDNKYTLDIPHIYEDLYHVDKTNT